jgi:hypothetical protein
VAVVENNAIGYGLWTISKALIGETQPNHQASNLPRYPTIKQLSNPFAASLAELLANSQ